MRSLINVLVKVDVDRTITCVHTNQTLSGTQYECSMSLQEIVQVYKKHCQNIYMYIMYNGSQCQLVSDISKVLYIYTSRPTSSIQ